jgi:polyisoprenoid-binding protein YceI
LKVIHFLHAMKSYFQIWVTILCWLSLFLFSHLTIAQSYAIDVESSKISWTGWKQLFGNTVSQSGSLKFSSGSIKKKDGAFVNAHMRMDMNSIIHLNDGKAYTDNDVVTHLKSEPCFFVEKYPEAIFQLSKIETGAPDSDDSSVTGTLTIKGITKTISFPVNIIQAEKSLIVKAEFQINRKDFNLDLQPFLIRIGGDKIVRDNIDVSVEILAHSKS